METAQMVPTQTELILGGLTPLTCAHMGGLVPSCSQPSNSAISQGTGAITYKTHELEMTLCH